MNYDEHIADCVFTFLSQTNVKQYVLYCFENDMLLDAEQNKTLLDIIMMHGDVSQGFYVNLMLLRQTFFEATFNRIWDCFEVGFYLRRDIDNIFDFINESNITVIRWAHNALYNYPPYREHIKNVKQMQECDIVKIANNIVREMPHIVVCPDVVVGFPYDFWYAFDEFFEENNIKEYVLFCFENPDDFGRKLLWDYVNGVRETHISLIAYIRRHIKFLLCSETHKLDTLFESNFHKMFIIQRYAERDMRRIAFLVVVDAIYDDYCHTRVADRVLVDDYIAKHIYGFL